MGWLGGGGSENQVCDRGHAAGEQQLRLSGALEMDGEHDASPGAEIPSGGKQLLQESGCAMSSVTPVPDVKMWVVWDPGSERATEGSMVPNFFGVSESLPGGDRTAGIGHVSLYFPGVRFHAWRTPWEA